MSRVSNGITSETMPWSILSLVWIPGVLVSLGIMNHAPLLSLIQQDFKVDNTWFGVLTSATLLSHTALQLLGGQAADALGAKRTMICGVAILGLAMLGAGLAPTFELLLLGRLVMGVGTALAWIGAMASTEIIVPASKRSAGQGILGGLSSGGFLLALLTSERLASLFGWRGVFVLEAAIIVAVAIVEWRALHFEEPKRPTDTVSIKESLVQSHLYILGFAQIMAYGIVVALGTWATTFIWKDLGMGMEWAGPLAALGMMGSVVARSVGGVLAARRERQAILLAGFLTAVCVFCLPRMPGVAPTIIMLILAYTAASYSFGAVFAYAPMISTRGTAGRNISIISFVSNLGALFFPPFVGYILDTAGSFVVGFTVVAAIGVVGSTIVVFVLPKPPKDQLSVINRQ